MENDPLWFPDAPQVSVFGLFGVEITTRTEPAAPSRAEIAFRSANNSYFGQGSCQETPSLFEPQHTAQANRERIEAQAKALCGRCTLRDVCLASALARDESGVRGGTIANERQVAIAAARRDARRIGQESDSQLILHTAFSKLTHDG
jgi:hypothetical protein